MFQKDLKTKNDFPHGYGSFPYVIVRLGPARYLQLPIHRVTREEEPLLSGIFISEKEKPDPQVRREHNLDALMQVREQHYDKVGKNLPMCLVEGPEDAIYVDEQGNASENSSIPKGGVLISATHEIISMEGPHYFEG